MIGMLSSCSPDALAVGLVVGVPLGAGATGLLVMLVNWALPRPISYPGAHDEPHGDVPCVPRAPEPIHMPQAQPFEPIRLAERRRLMGPRPLPHADL